MSSNITIYDTTLRDGSQGEGINFSLMDKLRIAERLDEFVVHYIEGGWPGSNEKDIAFFEEAKKRTWKHAKITAFGSTRRPNVNVAEDQQIQLLLQAETPVITFFGKSWILHVKEVLRTTPEENLKMISDTVTYLKENGKEVIYDAEHFFDGYLDDEAYALQCLKVAADAGADYVVLCDTNGGRLPSQIAEITQQVMENIETNVGIHTHNDCGLGVANAIAALEAGALQVQGTMNGFGERTGNCNLTSVIPILELKMQASVLNEDKLSQLTGISRFVDEVANLTHDIRAPFVGQASFAHKGGMHVNAINKSEISYNHISPGLVGNEQRILVGELSGRTNVMMKAKELGLELDEKSEGTREILAEIKKKEAMGYEFEAADASFELIVQDHLQPGPSWFDLQEYHISMRKNMVHGFTNCEATTKIVIDGEIIYMVANGDGPVNALDNSLRRALSEKYPEVMDLHLVDYKVRIIDSAEGTAAKIRVFIESRTGDTQWGTVGVSDNIIEASWIALVDSIHYFLRKYRKS
ncbi:MAG: citramalate synthase [Verrucomicrobiota bacterium]